LVRAGWLDVAIARAAGLAAVRFSLRFRGRLVTTVIGGSVTPSPRGAGHSCAAAPLTTKEIATADVARAAQQRANKRIDMTFLSPRPKTEALLVQFVF
jgi:hypothetical protein